MPGFLTHGEARPRSGRNVGSKIHYALKAQADPCQAHQVDAKLAQAGGLSLVRAADPVYLGINDARVHHQVRFQQAGCVLTIGAALARQMRQAVYPL